MSQLTRLPEQRPTDEGLRDTGLFLPVLEAEAPDGGFLLRPVG